MTGLMSEAAGDAFLGGRLRLVQTENGHRAGLDAVMLAAAAKVSPGDRVLDAGAGMGVVGLCIASRVPACTVAGLEIDAALSRLATANATQNGLRERYRAINADLTLPLSRLAAAGLKPDSFEAVVANPPYYTAGRGTASRDPARARAAVMPEEGLDHWVRFMTAMAVPGGALTFVYPAAGITALLTALDGRCGGIVVFPLFPRVGEHAHRILVAGRKGSRAPLALRPGMVLHGPANAFTPEADAVLRHGAALDLGL